jgi:hypothetical protein
MTASKFSFVLPELIKQAMRKKAAGQSQILRTRIVEVAEHVTGDVNTTLTNDQMMIIAQEVGGTYVTEGRHRIVF